MYILLFLLELIQIYGFLVVGLRSFSFFTKSVQIPLLNYLNQILTFPVCAPYQIVVKDNTQYDDYQLIESNACSTDEELNGCSTDEESNGCSTDEESNGCSTDEESNGCSTDEESNGCSNNTKCVSRPVLQHDTTDSESDDDMPDLIDDMEENDRESDTESDSESTDEDMPDLVDENDNVVETKVNKTNVLLKHESDSDTDEDIKEDFKNKLLKIHSGIILMDEKLD
jgi:hypothetical protein